MDPVEIAAGLAGFDRRGAGSDAERRASLWLADRLRESGREVVVEPFWSRPNWALAHTWHVVLGLAGSLLSVHHARVGGALILVALLSLITDGLFGRSLGRRLTPERASQNIVAKPPHHTRGRPVRLILTANYDAGRTGLVYRDGVRVPLAGARKLTRGLGPGWLGWLAIALTWLLVLAIVRLEGTGGTLVGLLQLVPTVALVLAVAALLELAGSEFGPAAADNGTGVAAVIAIAQALDAGPPAHAAVEVVLTGAGDGSGLGLRRYFRARRRFLRATNTVVVGFGACAAGRPRWWHSDGALVPVRHFSALRQLCRRLADDDPALALEPYRGRGASPALPARLAGFPSIAIGRLDADGLVPRSHQATDTPEALHRGPIDEIVETSLLLTDAIDGFLSRVDTGPGSARATGRRLWSRA